MVELELVDVELAEVELAEVELAEVELAEVELAEVELLVSPIPPGPVLEELGAPPVPPVSLDVEPVEVAGSV